MLQLQAYFFKLLDRLGRKRNMTLLTHLLPKTLTGLKTVCERTVIPERLRNEIMFLHHDVVLGAYLGRMKTTERIKSIFGGHT